MRKIRQNNFAYLLCGLLSLMVLMPALRLLMSSKVEADLMRPVLLLVFSLFTMVGVWSLYLDRKVFRLGVAIAVFNIAIPVASLFFRSEILQICSALSVLFFAMLSGYAAARHVFSFTGDVDANSLFGAVCVYLLLGLIWALVYAVLNFIWPQGAFQGIAFDNKTWQFDTYLYFSFSTLTSVGYGDITPLHPLVRTIAYLEMITGQFYMAILVSGLVAHFMGKRISL